MQKKVEKIIVIILIWASLFIVVLYSPIMSPDLYSSNNYSIVNQGSVSPNDQIKNTPFICKNNANNSQSTSFKTYESEENYFNNRVICSGSNDEKQESTTGSMSYSTDVYKNIGNRSMMAAEVCLGNSTISKSSKNDVASSMVSIQTLFDDNKNNRQKIDYNPNYGASDPGDDPIGNPIPVGDGWMYMLFLALGYAVWKRFNPKLH